MAKYSKTNTASKETQDEAMKIASGTQRPGQTKDQTRLIAQGIQKGIDLYKKQQKAKSRELDKKLKRVSKQLSEPAEAEAEAQEIIITKQHRLPWVLLVASWIAFSAFLLLSPS